MRALTTFLVLAMANMALVYRGTAAFSDDLSLPLDLFLYFLMLVPALLAARYAFISWRCVSQGEAMASDRLQGSTRKLNTILFLVFLVVAYLRPSWSSYLIALVPALNAAAATWPGHFFGFPLDILPDPQAFARR